MDFENRINEEIEEENDKEFLDVGIKINDFTTLLNKYNLAYKVVLWNSGEGYSIEIDKTSIDFYLSGRIEFNEMEKNE